MLTVNFKNTFHLFAQVSKLILFFILVALFVPFSPKMPAPGLDASWALGLNQAVAQGLAFGKEIIFTLGPYSSIYTKMFHPTTSLMMYAGSLYLSISYWVILVLLIKNKPNYLVIMLSIPLLGMIYSRDSLLFSYPLLISLYYFQCLADKKTIHHTSLLICTLLFAPLGLLALIKGSLLILCLATLILCSSFFILECINLSLQGGSKQFYKLSIICLCSPAAAMSIFWMASGQTLGNLPAYILNTLIISSGFSEAMSTFGNNLEVVLYLFNALLILCSLFWQKDTSSLRRLFLFSLYFIFLFVSFKTGFTRHYGHAFIAGTSILMASLFLLLIQQSKLNVILVFLSINSWFVINSHYTHISLSTNFKSNYSSAWYGFKRSLEEPSWLETNFNLSMNFLQTQNPLPTLAGTTDIYSYNQAYLLSSANIWSPRPVFQSYSVFMPSLIEKNKQHLQGKHKPDHIIFNIEPIDKRLPALEDGASWPLILKNYKPSQVSNNFLILDAKPDISKPKKPTALISSRQHQLGEEVFLPPNKGYLFAKISLKPTLWGKIAAVFYKPSPLMISMILQNGTEKNYRFIASMARSGFLISPLVENTRDFNALFNNPDFPEHRVKSIRITRLKNSKHWENIYQLQVKT